MSFQKESNNFGQITNKLDVDNVANVEHESDAVTLASRNAAAMRRTDATPATTKSDGKMEVRKGSGFDDEDKAFLKECMALVDSKDAMTQQNVTKMQNIMKPKYDTKMLHNDMMAQRNVMLSHTNDKNATMMQNNDPITPNKSAAMHNDTVMQKNDTVMQQNDTIIPMNDKMTQNNNIIAEKRGAAMQRNDTMTQKNEMMKQKNATFIHENSTIISMNDKMTRNNDTITHNNDAAMHRNDTKQKNATLTHKNDTMNDKNTGNIVTIAEKRGAVMDETDAMTLKRARLEESIEMTNLDESDEEDAAFLGQCRALIERKDEVTQYSVRATFQNDASTQRKQDPARHDATGGKDQGPML